MYLACSTFQELYGLVDVFFIVGHDSVDDRSQHGTVQDGTRRKGTGAQEIQSEEQCDDEY